MRLLGIAILAGIVVLGCSPNPLPGPVVDQQPTEQTSAVSTEAVEPTETAVVLISELVPIQTYEDPYLAYAFDYPLDWSITAVPEVPGATVTIHSWAPRELAGDRPQSEGIPEGGEKLDITPLSSIGLDYAAALPWFREQNSNQVFSEQPVRLPNGAPGVPFIFEQLEGEVGVRCLITEVPATPILLCGLAWEFEYFEPIALSVR